MKLAIIFGASGNDVKQKLLSVKDNLTIDSFKTIDEMISNSSQRNYTFDRILILSNLVKALGVDTCLNTLLNYSRQRAPQTNIILLCNSDNDEELANKFNSMFNKSVCTAMKTKSITMLTLTESAVKSVNDINIKYGTVVNIDVEIEEDTFILPEPEVASVPQIPTVVAPIKEKKKGFLSGLLKTKKPNKIQEQPQVEPLIIQSKESISNSNNSDWEDQFDENLETQQENVSNMQSTDLNQIKEEETVIIQEELPDDFEDELTDDLEYTENDEDNLLDSSLTEVSDFDSDFGDIQEQDDSSLFDNAFDELNEDVEEELEEELEELEEENEEVDEELEEVEEDTNYEFIDETNSSGAEIIETTESPVIESKRLVRELPVEANEDFGDITFEDIESESNEEEKPALEEVTVEMGDMSLGAMEDSYREQTEQPKIIERIVEKEVIKEVKTHSNGVLASVLSGKANKIILVTGDRGSGVTTTALDIAKFFSKHVSVLYLDGDCETHGLLSYIDYNEFRKYETQHMQGLKLCRSSKAFNNCAMKFDNNLDILSTNYGVTVTDDELELAQSVVAEVSHNYGVVVVDVPIDKLNNFCDLIIQGNIVICCEATKRGFMNMLCKLEDSKLPLRFKRSIVSKGTLALTKIHPKMNVSQLSKYVRSIIDFEDIDWLDMHTVERQGEMTSKFIEDIIEG